MLWAKRQVRNREFRTRVEGWRQVRAGGWQGRCGEGPWFPLPHTARALGHARCHGDWMTSPGPVRWMGPLCPVTPGLPPAPGTAVTPVIGPNETPWALPGPDHPSRAGNRQEGPLGLPKDLLMHGARGYSWMLSGGARWGEGSPCRHPSGGREFPPGEVLYP